MSEQPPSFLSGDVYRTADGSLTNIYMAAKASGILDLDTAAQLLAEEYRYHFNFNGRSIYKDVDYYPRVYTSSALPAFGQGVSKAAKWAGLAWLSPYGQPADRMDTVHTEVAKIILNTIDPDLHAANVIQGMDFQPLFEYVYENAASFGLDKAQKSALNDMLGSAASYQLARAKENIYNTVVGEFGGVPQYAFQRYPVEILESTAYRMVTEHYNEVGNVMYPRHTIFSQLKIGGNDPDYPGFLDLEAEARGFNVEDNGFDYMDPENISKMPEPLAQYVSGQVAEMTAPAEQQPQRQVGYTPPAPDRFRVSDPATYMNPTTVRPDDDPDEVYVSIAGDRQTQMPNIAPAGRSRGFRPQQQNSVPPSTTIGPTQSQTQVGNPNQQNQQQQNQQQQNNQPVVFTYDELVGLFRIYPDTDNVLARLDSLRPDPNLYPDRAQAFDDFINNEFQISIDDTSWVQDLGLSPNKQYSILDLAQLPYSMNPGGLRVMHNMLALSGYYGQQIPNSLTNPGDPTLLNAWGMFVSDAIRQQTPETGFDNFLNNAISNNVSRIRNDWTNQTQMNARSYANMFSQQLLGRDLNDDEYNLVQSALQNVGQEQFAAQMLGDVDVAPFISTIQETVEGIGPEQQEAYQNTIRANNIWARLTGQDIEQIEYVQQYSADEVAQALGSGAVNG